MQACRNDMKGITKSRWAGTRNRGLYYVVCLQEVACSQQTRHKIRLTLKEAQERLTGPKDECAGAAKGATALPVNSVVHESPKGNRHAELGRPVNQEARGRLEKWRKRTGLEK